MSREERREKEIKAMGFVLCAVCQKLMAQSSQLKAREDIIFSLLSTFYVLRGCLYNFSPLQKTYYIVRPTASAMGFNSSIIRLNFSGNNDCSPSLLAFSGSAWTSTSMPSAPHAKAALLIGEI